MIPHTHHAISRSGLRHGYYLAMAVAAAGCRPRCCLGYSPTGWHAYFDDYCLGSHCCHPLPTVLAAALGAAALATAAFSLAALKVAALANDALGATSLGATALGAAALLP